MNYPVKYYHSGMPGAPILSNNWGDLVGLLDACLVTGFNLKTINTLISAAGVATATVSSGHNYLLDQVVLIAGCDQAAYNGEQRITAITANTFSFAVAGTPPSPATTLTAISCKVAALGWEKPFSGTNKAAYRSSDPTSTRHYLRVDDDVKAANGFTTYAPSWAKWANVGICENMSDIDTITGAQAPFDPLNPTQNWKAVQANQWGWHIWPHAIRGGKTDDGGAGPRQWVIVGDGRTFYLSMSYAPGLTWYGRTMYCFGDPISFKPGDAYGTMLTAEDFFGDVNFTYPGQRSGYGLVSSLDIAGKLLLRDHTQLGNPVRWGSCSLNTNNAQQISGFGQTVPFPNGPDFSLLLAPVYMRQENGHLRGLLPGLRWVLQDRPLSDLAVVGNINGEPGKQFLFVRNQHGSEANRAQLAFDITGPWR